GVEYIADTSGTAWTTIRQDSNTVPKLWFNVNFTNNINVTYYAEVDPNHIYPETNEGNNRFPAVGTQSVTFQKRRTFDVMGWRMRYHPAGFTGNQYAGGWAVNSGGADWLETLWPVKEGGIDYSLHSGYMDWTSVIGKGDEAKVVALTKTILMIEAMFPWYDPQLQGQERVNVWTPRAHFVRGLSDPPGWGGGFGVASVGDDNPNGNNTMDNPGFGAHNFVHEVSHNTGMRHIGQPKDPCGSEDSGTDWPYSNYRIQEFGYDPDTGKIYNPSSSGDIMSYCYGPGTNAWISPFHWTQQFNVEGAIGSFTAGGPRPIVAAVGDVLGVVATVDNPSVAGSDGNSLELHKTAGGGNIIPPPPGAGYSVELRSGAQVLASQDFAASFVNVEDPGAPHGQVTIAFSMPWVDGTTSVVLLHGPEVLQTVNVSSNAPTVVVTDPSTPEVWSAGTVQNLSWNGNDTDSDPLTYSVFYSDDGVSFEILATGLTGTSYQVDVDSIAGGNTAVLRVVANDGVNTGFGDSAAVSVPNKAPFTAITSPGDGALAPLGGLVVFNGGATDLEDGPIPDGSLSWSSNVDGLLGTGSSLPVNNLTAGLHTITLRATDSNAAFTEESVQIVVGFPLTIDVQPNRMSSVGPPAGVTVVATLPPGYPTENINLNTLRLHINGVELTPTSSEQLGDPDEDGLPELKLTFDGAAVQAALPDGPGSTDAVLAGEMVGGMQIQGSDTIGLALSGDSDCSGIVNAVDALKVLRFVAGFGPSSCILETDVDCNGLVNAVDALKILRFVAGLPPTGLPEGCPGISAPAPAAAAVMSTSDRSSTGDAWLGALLAVPALVMAGRRRSR
ncbi:MAG TPA: hypothetical protein VFO59_04730, partial [Dehalococcoidia bacterium]|nr:hypothetical protein [Dehalococcoidia bacterium]